jgi:hypothetical protein
LLLDEQMSFGNILNILQGRDGRFYRPPEWVRRASWTNKSMMVGLTKQKYQGEEAPHLILAWRDDSLNYCLIPWFPNPYDLAADDWYVHVNRQPA